MKFIFKKNIITNKKNLIYYLLILIFTILFFLFLESIRNQYFLYGDNASYFLPYYVHNYRSLFEYGQIAQINFHQFMGIAHLATGQSAVLYLPNYFGIFFSKLLTGDFFYSIDLICFIHILFSGILVYYYLCKNNIKSIISFFISLIWITVPYTIIISNCWNFFSYTSLFIPLNLIFLDRLLEKPELKYSLYLALINTLFFFGGYTQHFHVLIIFDLIYIIINIILTKKDACIKIFTSFLFSLFSTFIFSLPLFLPVLNNFTQSFRKSGLPLEWVIRASVTVKDFIGAQFYSFKPNNLLFFNTEILFCGLLFVIVLLFLINKKLLIYENKNKLLLFGIISISFFLLSTKLYGYLYNIPTFKLFKEPFKNYIFFIFSYLLTLGFICDFIVKLSNNIKKYIVIFLLILFTFSNIFILYNARNTGGNTLIISNINSEYKNIFTPNIKGRIVSCYTEGLDPSIRYKYLSFNFATFFNINHFAGFEVFAPKMNIRYSQGIFFTNSLEIELNNSAIDYLNMCGVRYYVTADNFKNRERFSAFKALKLIYEKNNVLVYESTKVNPIVFFNDIYNHNANIYFTFKGNDLLIYPDNDIEGNVIIAITPLKGFSYYINDKYTGEIEENVFPVKIKIPKNTKLLKIAYRDKEFEKGIIISICYIFLLFLYWCFTKFFFFSKKHKSDKIIN